VKEESSDSTETDSDDDEDKKAGKMSRREAR
jgi:hypothetical protein